MVSLVWHVLGLVALLGALDAHGHATQLSASRITVTGRDIAATVEMNRRDVEVALRVAGGSPGEAAVGRYLSERVHLRHPQGGDCPMAIGKVRPKDDHLLVDLRWQCPPVAGRLEYEVGLFIDIDPAARHLVTVTGDVRRIGLLTAGNPRLDLVTLSPGVAEVFGHYLLAGIEHIAIGFDHLAFLFAVILWGRRFWPLAAVVTAFTVAHTVTLALAVLDVARLPAALVELLIALSIVYVAAENFFVRDVRHRWGLTFLFGLVHGFGFASVLRDYGLPGDARVPALAAFNVGVEIGQLAFVGIALTLIRSAESMLRRGSDGATQADPRVVKTTSGALLLLGLYWTLGRIPALA
ncbi:MAG: HupE/UreJ family protein [Burkholderiales bacterium]